VIDLHCHFLPGIDDGAQTLEESLELARAAVAAGIHIAVMTPHVHPGRYENDARSIAKLCGAFGQVLAHRGIALGVRIGGEVRISEEIMRMVDEEQIPYLGESGGFRIMLLEFPHSHIIVGTQQLLAWLLDRKIRPLIAHPERNREVMRDPEKLEPFIQMGCLLQLTGGSILGRFGKPAQECAVRLIERDWAAVVATDSHNMVHRPPDLDDAYAALVRLGGEPLARALTTDNPAKLIMGNALDRRAHAPVA
jgi:protein-tyrosine phosphatase